jgi:hypothetical protein
MNVKLILTIFILIIAFTGRVNAQDKELVQVSGVVVSRDTAHVPIPFATVYNKNLKLGTYSNVEGFYTIIARPGDTILVTCIGYLDFYMVVPQLISNNSWVQIVQLTSKAYLLSETRVYPWGTRDQFRKAFVEMKLPEDDLVRYNKNLSPAQMKQLAALLSNDGKSASMATLQKFANSYYYKGQIQTSNIFNPIAWAQFFNDISTGKYKIEK